MDGAALCQIPGAQQGKPNSRGVLPGTKRLQTVGGQRTGPRRQRMPLPTSPETQDTCRVGAETPGPPEPTLQLLHEGQSERQAPPTILVIEQDPRLSAGGCGVLTSGCGWHQPWCVSPGKWASEGSFGHAPAQGTQPCPSTKMPALCRRRQF